MPVLNPVQVYEAILGRDLSEGERRGVAERLNSTPELVVCFQALASAEFHRRCLDSATPLHLLLIHSARIKLVSSMVPAARNIVDLGAANGTLYDLGYPHPFDELLAVDLPAEDRCAMYGGIKMNARETPNGPIRLLYADMTDLSAISTASSDLVWMGQAIEHISELDSFRLYREVKRILRPGGHFCLDTPNRNLTEIHTAGWIHPEHKVEYRPEHLRRNLVEAGFRIESELGLCEMIRTWQSKSFDYTDFLLGGGLSSNVAGSYIQYYHCRV
jgi:SAM-dependent methyltransferase